MTAYSPVVPVRARRPSTGSQWVTLAAAVGAGLNAGVFVAFSVFVMPAVRDLPAAQGIEAMQALNRTAVAPFTVVGLGTAGVCVVVLGFGARAWRTARGRWMLAGAVLYLVAAVLLTAGVNVPISATIDTLDPSAPDVKARWADLYNQWVWANHLRAFGSLGAAVALAVGLRTQR